VLQVASVHIAAWRETYPGLLPDAMLERLSIAGEAIRWQRMLDRPEAWGGAISFVAEQDGVVVGYGLCGEQRLPLLRERGFTSEIAELYVLRSSQRQGAGSKLMSAMAGALVARGHRAVSLWVLKQNAPAHRFYERLGGTFIIEKRADLIEVAYGWSDLPGLATRADN